MYHIKILATYNQSFVYFGARINKINKNKEYKSNLEKKENNIRVKLINYIHQ